MNLYQVSCVAIVLRDGAKKLLTVVFAVLSLVLLFYLANGLYEMQAEQRQAQISTLHPEVQSSTAHPEVKKQVLAVEVQKESPEFPVRLKIPRINVDAAIESVGLTSKGAMGVPNNSIDVGWFNLGPRPGEKGSAVIDGHLIRESGAAGVFTNLGKLKPGDKLYVEDSKGTSVAFVVRESRAYDPGYADAVFSQSDSAHLNLITCNGLWNQVKKSYNKRLVVFADITH